MTIFLFPTELEASDFRELCPHAEIVVSGVGMAETASTIARINQVYDLSQSVVILSGIAGAYDGRCNIGDVVEVVSEVVSELPVRFRRSYVVEAYTRQRLVKSNCVSGCGAECCDADIENMEGATLFAMAEAMGFRAVEIRAISNFVGDDFSKWSIELAVSNLAKTLVKYAK